MPVLALSRVIRALRLVAIAALVAAAPAAAKNSVSFDQRAARTGGRAAVVVAIERPVVAYLARLEHASRFFFIPWQGYPNPQPGPPPRKPGLHRIGALPATGLRPTRVEFRVPQVRAGRYTLVLWCKTCARGGTHWALAAINFVPHPSTVLLVRR